MLARRLFMLSATAVLALPLAAPAIAQPGKPIPVAALMREHDVRILIHGHTYRPVAHEFGLDGELARRYVLGDWYEQKSAIHFDGGRPVLHRQTP